jgi:ketosteroid isomerase-like protein
MNQTIITRFYESMNARDWQFFASLLTENIIYRVPQTREIICGKAAYVDFNATFPGNWTVEPLSIHENTQSLVARVKFEINNEVMTNIAYITLEDNKISQIEDFWCEDYEPPMRTSAFVERE